MQKNDRPVVHRALKSLYNRAHSGFTIVELLIVIVVIAVLAAIIMVSYNGIQQSAHASAARSGVTQATKKAMTYAIENADQYPGSLSVVGIASNNSITYQYTVDNAGSPRTFCVTATSGGAVYYQTNSANPVAGACPGHNSVALTCPSGFIQVPGSTTFGTGDFCVMKYEAKQASSTVPVSQAAGLPWTPSTQVDASAYSANVAGCSGCHLINEAEWLTIAHNVLSVASNWSGGSVGSGYIYSGHHDNSPSSMLAADTNDTLGYSGTGNGGTSNQRRTLTLTNGEVIWDIAGNLWEWTSGSASSGQPGISGEACYGYKEWSAINVNGTLTPSPRPSFGTAAAVSWTSAQGIGKLYSCSSEISTVRGFARGGDWNEIGALDSPDTAGVFALAMGTPPTAVNAGFGFRATR